MHEFAQDDDQEPLLSFVLPMLADDSQISTQIFFNTKFLLNKASEYSVSERQKLRIFLISGSFFKTAAEDLGLASLQWSSIAVS